MDQFTQRQSNSYEIQGWVLFPLLFVIVLEYVMRLVDQQHLLAGTHPVRSAGLQIRNALNTNIKNKKMRALRC